MALRTADVEGSVESVDEVHGLTIRGLRKSYGAVTALQGVDLRLAPGSIHGLLGGNGSGKSTLAKILIGTTTATSGSVCLDGEELAVSRPSDAYRAGVACTFQELSLVDDLSVEENLALADVPGRVLTSRKVVRARAEAALRSVSLSDHVAPTDRIPSLGANDRYMLEFAKAVQREPKVLVVDEITSALYRDDVSIVAGVLRQLAATGVAVLFIGHRMSEILDICDEVSVLRNGRITATFATGEVDEATLVHEMVGRAPAELVPTASSAGAGSGPVALSTRGLRVPGHTGSVDLEVRAGTIVGVAGLQGQGQTELLRSLFGMHGEVRVCLDGVQARLGSPRQAALRGLAYVSGDRVNEGTFSGRSLRENLGAVAELVLGHRVPDARSELDRLGVKFSRPGQAISSLSGGNQQKVVLGRWLSARPRVLLADDATKGVDVAARRDLHQLIRDLVATGSSVVFASSDEEELVELVGSQPGGVVHVMYGGSIVAEVTGADITVDRLIEAGLPSEQAAS